MIIIYEGLVRSCKYIKYLGEAILELFFVDFV